MSDKPVWHQLLKSRHSRRNALKGGLLAAGASALPISLQAAALPQENASGSSPRLSGQAARLNPPFRPIKPTTADDLVLPRGYRYNPVRIYGDEIAPGVPFGYNADYIGYYPIDWLEGGRSSSDGILTVNHEYNNPLLQYGYTGGPKLPEQINLERATNGISLFRVQRQRNGT